MAANDYGAILAADFGSVHTRLVLLDLVDGAYRLVGRADARTTDNFPYNDVRVGLARAADVISRAAGRPLTTADSAIITPEQPDHSGVAHFVATASTGRPLRAIIVGLVPEISLSSALRATAGTYIEVVDTLSLEDRRSEEDLLNAIVLSSPDLVLIAGGTEGGAHAPLLALVRVVEQATALSERAHRPVIVYAGNSALVPQLHAAFDGQTTLFIAANVRPALDSENLDSARLQLGRAFNQYVGRRGSDFDAIGRASAVGVLPTALGCETLVEYLGQTDRGPALFVDVGSAVSTLAAYQDGAAATVIRTDLGLGHSAYSLLRTLGPDKLLRWLPFPSEPGQLENYALNKTVRPGTVPETQRDLYLEHALLRAALAELLAASRPVAQAGAAPPSYNLIIGGGAALTRTGSPGLGAMLLLDALQPEGVTTLLADPYGLVSALGALARVQPEAVVQTLDSGALECLGTCVSLSGQPRADRPALRVKITRADGSVTEEQVAGGHLWVYPLPEGETAQVDVRVVGRGAHLGGRSRLRQAVVGGSAGLIFDARGRPLPLANTPAGRAAQMPHWFAEASGLPLQDIDPRWLQPARAAGEKPAASARPPRGQRRQHDAPPPPETGDSEMEDLRNALS